MQTIVIGTYDLPQESAEAFLALTSEVQELLSSLPGFVEGNVYEERAGEGGRRQIVTVAFWENDEAYENAVQAVAEWNRQRGVDSQAQSRQLGVVGKRSVYNRIAV